MDKCFSRITVRSTVLFLLVVVVVMQLYRPHKNDKEEEVADDFLELTNAPEDIAVLFKNSCYDCHSNHTNYEWYDNIAPISWWIDNTVAKGKVAINFSEWEHTAPQKRLSFLSASVFDIKTDKMPTALYIKMHPSAKLSIEDKETILIWINAIDRFDPYYDINKH